MLTSIIIPMRNAEPFIAETVRSLLAQDTDIEIIVIDDGSTDRSAEIVRSMHDGRIRLINGPQRGISAAVNAGIAAARGELLCRCDADDLYPPGRLARQVMFLQTHPEFGAVCGGYRTIDPKGHPVSEHNIDASPAEITDELKDGGGRSHMCAYLFRTGVVRQIGGCREWFITSEDADLQYRLAEHTRIWFDPEGAYLYRLHDASITHAQKSLQRQFFRECAVQFQQQRRSGGQDDLQRGAPPVVPMAGSTDARSTHEQIQQILLGEAWKLHASGRRMNAMAAGMRACIQKPGNIAAWRSLAALAIKPRSRKMSAAKTPK
ncbi:MAG TPA: glycosyltransferase [Tepidisphaeraceae bacterium]|nr:glycosyltransferase [Tepidisphaeraceae bacterium]